MRRPAHAEKVLERLGKWRDVCPDIAVRSTFIVGFPGETDDDFETLLDFLQEAELDRVGAFTYSAVEGAPANAREGAVPEDVKEERLERFMEVQAEISAAKLSRMIGKTLTVLVDDAEDGQSLARSYRDAPEIDGQVVIEGVELPVGEFVKVRVTHADEHDLWAEVIN
jgi:ribosomal protein S12 methylthiotransferase